MLITVIVTAALAGAAYADDPARAWETLYDARLVEAADGTPEVAVLYYEELAGDLAPTDPLYGTTWYWLGRTRYGLGNSSGAVQALQNALTVAAVAPQAAALLGRIELEQHAVRSFPVRFDFEDGPGAFVRAWEGADKGTLEARSVLGRPVLAWGTTVMAGEADHIAAALAGNTPASSVSFEVRAQSFPAELRVTVSDGAGGRYSAPVIQVPTGQWMEIDLPASSFRSTDGARGGGGNALQPSDAVRLIELEDLTALLSPDRGMNTIYIDGFELR